MKDVVRKQRRVNGVKENYIYCNVTGKEYASMKEYNASKSNELTSRKILRFKLYEQVAYSYARNRSTEDKKYIAYKLSQDEFKSYETINKCREKAKKYLITDFTEDVVYKVWDNANQQWLDAEEDTPNALPIPEVKFLVEDYMTRLLRQAQVICGNRAYTVPSIKQLLGISQAEAYRWYNAVLDAYALCTAPEPSLADAECPF